MQAPPNAFFSGYSMPSIYYRKLASALRSEPYPPPDSDTEFMEFVGYYKNWRRRLSEEDHPKAPSPKILNTDKGSLNLSMEDDPDTKLFFPTRWAPAGEEDVPSEEHQLENEADRARRDVLLALILERNHFEVDKSFLRFECVKRIHPLHDRYYGVRQSYRRESLAIDQSL
ncbi:hypothetical protein FB45DRAFT_1017523 [Roridomyces roridus]|uniref:Uncharacterized protein n=1 Tax=Roridomyces roridus TaxID=1738132 RepID=A0AAD7CIR9_9AGAR|nr:hypothetical protein FB45DRAFT_1017523 [Roridomyces roridus]